MLAALVDAVAGPRADDARGGRPGVTDIGGEGAADAADGSDGEAEWRLQAGCGAARSALGGAGEPRCGHGQREGRRKLLKMDNPDILRIPLYKLFYIDDLESFSGLTAEETAAMHRGYTAEVIDEIVAAMRWSVEDTDVDLTRLSHGLSYSNDQLRRFLRRMLESIERELEARPMRRSAE